MLLTSERIVEGDRTDFTWEREGINFVLEALPDSDPHQVWPLHELLDAATGRLYEIDLLVLARNGLYLVEIKSHPGVLSGDILDWTFTEANGQRRHLANPYRATSHKARVLASRLGSKLGDQRPYVQPLIFLSHPEVVVRLEGGCPRYVTTRENIRHTLVHGLDVDQGLDRRRRPVVNRPMQRKVRKVLKELGFAASQARRTVGGFRLERLLEERDAYQEHHATSLDILGDTARVRSYLVPQQTSVERRQQLERAAQREARILSRLGHHPNILSFRHYEKDGPLGPAVLFEPFAEGRALHTFLKQEPELPFDDRLHILQAVVEAVDHCHRAGFLHRNLSPASVLVRRREGVLEVRLHRFQTAAQNEHSSLGTHHLQQLAEDLDPIYQAPEVLRDPQKARTTSDVFSLGCLAWLLFTGQHPAPTVALRAETLRQNGGLQLSTVREDLATFDEALAIATDPLEIHRPEGALEWFEVYFLEGLTRPEPSAAQLRDPYEAEKGAVLGNDLQVLRLLGSGATARVFKVQRAGRHGQRAQVYALKVPHDEGCSQRLVEEGKVLARLRHQHIVQLHETLELGGRFCLLLAYAGLDVRDAGEGGEGVDHSSFADLLRSQGTLSLEKARRYGEDLLSAVQYLEEQGITHRDIKPGNLGFTSQSKKARHLTLYDFSLAASEATAVRAGTPEWRDPWLAERGRWDSAADRYAVACVLYHMVAGSRPELAADGGDGERVRIEAERFDPSVRDRLCLFFARTFAAAVAERYPNAETMRSEWVGLFSSLAQHPVRELNAAAELDPQEILQAATLATLVEVLPLSSRAKNALDRAGVLTVEHLLALPRNLLSAIRGVGHQVGREIVHTADQLQQRLGSVGPGSKPFVEGFPGPRIGLGAEVVGLRREVLRKLADVGITSTTELAEAAVEWMERLLGPAAGETRQALTTLASHHTVAGTLEEWAEDFLAPRKSRKTAAELRVRMLVGLDPLPAEKAVSAVVGEAVAGEAVGTRTVRQVAAAFDIEPALVFSSLQAQRRQWRQASLRQEFERALHQVFEVVGPLATLAAVAAELDRVHGPGTGAGVDRQALAVALVRLATEFRPNPLLWRLLGGSAWVAREAAHLDSLASLAAVAEELAALAPLAASETVRVRLAEVAAGTVLEVLAPDALLRLAVAASTGAAASARMEIYPRAMSARRALQLSLHVLGSAELTADALRRRVEGRYPEAEPLPPRPALDELMAEHGWEFDQQVAAYVRPGLAHATSGATVQLPTRQSSALPGQRRAQSAAAMEARAFEDALRRGVESGRFRAVQVRADFAERAALLLGSFLGVAPRSLDHEVWKVMAARAAGLPDPAVVMVADREGEGGAEWPELRKFVESAALEVVERLLAQRGETLLLVNPGVLARFELREVLFRLSDGAQNEEGAAVVLVVPSHADGQAPSINHRLPVPTVAGGQRMWLPESWIRNAHNAPDSAPDSASSFVASF